MAFDLTPLTQEELGEILASATPRKTVVSSPLLAQYEFVHGDICRLASSVVGSKGRRYSYLRQVSEISSGETLNNGTAHVELRDLKSGNVRCVSPDVVILDVKATNALRHREVNK